MYLEFDQFSQNKSVDSVPICSYFMISFRLSFWCSLSIEIQPIGIKCLEDLHKKVKHAIENDIARSVIHAKDGWKSHARLVLRR